MKQNGILVKNEIEANQFAAKIMLITIAFVFMLFLMKVFGILTTPMGMILLAMGVAVVFLVLPAIIVFILKKQDAWVKYVIATLSVLAAFINVTILSQNAILLYCYPVAIASLYFSRKLSLYTVAFSTVMLSLAQFLSMFMGVTDKNLDTVRKMILLGIIPRAIEFLMISVIFIYLSQRYTRNASERNGCGRSGRPSAKNPYNDRKSKRGIGSFGRIGAPT